MSDQTCKTCRHWQIGKDDRYSTILFPYRPDKDWEQCETEAEVVAVYGYRVRRCHHPKLLFYQRPERHAAAVCDGSEYKASLVTAEDFGCVLHER